MQIPFVDLSAVCRSFVSLALGQTMLDHCVNTGRLPSRFDFRIHVFSWSIQCLTLLNLLAAQKGAP